MKWIYLIIGATPLFVLMTQKSKVNLAVWIWEKRDGVFIIKIQTT